MEKFNQSQLDELIRFAAKLGVKDRAVVASGLVVANIVSDFDETKTIFRGSMPPPGTYGYLVVKPLVEVIHTRSIKIQNLAQADARALIELAAGGVLTGADIATEPHPIIIAAGLLLMICSFTRSMTIELSEREASVFWGLIKSCDKSRVAKLEAIIASTNKIRQEAGLDPLSEIQIRASLHELIKIKSISPIKGKPDAWRIRERWRRH